METINNFGAGLFKDLKPVSQPRGTYKHLLNAVRNIDGTPVNERGTLPVISVKDNYEIVALEALDTDIIIISTSNLSTEIGTLSNDDIYTPKLTTSDIKLNKDRLVSCVVKKDYRGHRLVYFTDGVDAVRRVDLDDIPVDMVDKRTKLFMEYDLPSIALKDITEEGNLPSGIYQAACRLVTSDRNATQFSLITNPISIVDESKSINSNQIDGALPQSTTGKAIKFTLSNIDTTYEYVEIAIITYIGTENALRVTLLPLQLIANRSSFDYTYSDASQHHKETTLNEILQQYAYYDTAQHIMDKDGYLLLANLRSEEEKYDFQSVANQIGIKWFEEEMMIGPHPDMRMYKGNTQHGQDVGNVPLGAGYKNELTASTKVTYQRGEAYSFSLVPIFTGKKFGNEYHIPAKAFLNSRFLSDVEYSESDYNTSTAKLIAANTDTKRLGCKISTLRYPPGMGYPDTPIRYHVMPTVEQSPFSTSQPTIYSHIAIGVEIDEPKFTAEQKSVLEGYIIVRRHRSEENKTIVSQGIAQNLMRTGTNGAWLVPTPAAGKWPSTIGGKTYNNLRSKKEVAFYSPETIILEKELSSVTKLVPVAKLSGRSFPIKHKVTGGRSEEHVHLFNNYDKIEPSGFTSQTIVSGTTHYVPKDVGTPEAYTGTQGKVYSLQEINGYLTFTLTEDLHMHNTLYSGKPEFQFAFDSNGVSTAYIINDSGVPIAVGSSTADKGGITDRLLYNLVIDRPAQYGEIQEGQSMYVGHRLFSEGKTGPLKLFGGDTFIGKIGIVSSTAELADGLTAESRGLRFRTLNYFPVESTINVNYRHYTTGLESDEGVGTVSYYPKNNKLWTGEGTGVLEIYPQLGHCTGYNRQYSFVNTLRPFFPKGLGFVDVSDFSNRVIYSSKGIEGEQYDSYRTFLMNNYHDITRAKGEITDVFEHRGGLYIHTTQSLFRALFNEQTTQATSSGEIFLGNGGLFPVPSKEILTVDGGFAGTQNKFASCATPFGRFFVDQKRKAVFLLEDFPMDISSTGMSTYFENTLLKGHMMSVYDSVNKRWILSGVNFTISYSPLLKSWSSEHSYRMKTAILDRNKVFITEQGNKSLYTLGEGNYGVYFEESAKPMEIEFIVNEAVDASKVFDNMVLYLSSEDDEGKSLPYETFDFLQFYNELQHSGVLSTYVPKTFMEEFEELIYSQIMLKKKGREFRLAIPFNMVKDVNTSIFSNSNLATDTSFKPRFSDKYLVVKGIYNNFANNRFQINAVKTLFRLLAG
jgi:hypothetical protein